MGKYTRKIRFFAPQKIKILPQPTDPNPIPTPITIKSLSNPLQYAPTLTFSNIKWQNISCADIVPTFPVISPPPLFFEAKFSLYQALSITSRLSTPLASTLVVIKPSGENPGAKTCQRGNPPILCPSLVIFEHHA